MKTAKQVLGELYAKHFTKAYEQAENFDDDKAERLRLSALAQYGLAVIEDDEFHKEAGLRKWALATARQDGNQAWQRGVPLNECEL